MRTRSAIGLLASIILSCFGNAHATQIEMHFDGLQNYPSHAVAGLSGTVFLDFQNLQVDTNFRPHDPSIIDGVQFAQTIYLDDLVTDYEIEYQGSKLELGDIVLSSAYIELCCTKSLYLDTSLGFQIRVDFCCDIDYPIVHPDDLTDSVLTDMFLSIRSGLYIEVFDQRDSSSGAERLYYSYAYDNNFSVHSVPEPVTANLFLLALTLLRWAQTRNN